MRLKDTLFESILDRELVVASSGSGGLAELLFNLLNPLTVVINLHGNHLARVLLHCGRVLLRLAGGTCLHDLLVIAGGCLHAGLGPVAQHVLVVACRRVRVGLQQRVRDAVVVGAAALVRVGDEHTRPQLVLEQTVIQGVVAEIRRQLVPRRRQRVLQDATQVLHGLRAVLSLLLHEPVRALREVGGIVTATLHALDDHLVLGLVGLLLDGDHLLGKHRQPDLLVHGLLRDVLLDRVERVLVRHVDARVSLRLRGLHANLNPRFLVALRIVSTSG